MKNKGQVTIFIVIGIIFLLSLILIIALNTKVKDTIVPQIILENLFLRKTDTVKSFVDSCLDKVSKEVLLLNNIQGGKLNLPENIKSIGEISTSFLFFKNVASLLDKEEMEMEISLEINRKLPQCTNDFSQIEDVKIISGNVRTKTSINEEDVTFDVLWPIIIRQNQFTKEISEYQARHEITLKNMIERVNEILNDLIEHPQYLDLFFSSFLGDQMTDIKMQIDNDGFTFLNIDENSIIDNRPFSFMFATQPQKDEKENKKPILAKIPQLTAKEGERFTYTVRATDPENDQLTFLSSSPVIPVQSITGIIDFIPRANDIGIHIVHIRVIDTAFNFDEQFVTITITGENSKPKLYVQDQSIKLGEEFSYQPDVLDFDSTDFIFSIIEGPDSAEIQENSGLITWIPDEAGKYEFIIGVSDGINNVNRTFFLEVIEVVNNPPIVYVKDQPAKINQNFSYKPYIFDIDDDDLILKVQSPTEAQVEDNTIKWLPKNTGIIEFTISVFDSKNETKAKFNVEVK